jgi:thymidylate kinase
MEPDLVFVEFVGLVGAGKSTFVVALNQLMRESGFQVWSLDQAVRLCVGRSRVGQWIEAFGGASRFAPSLLRLWLLVTLRFYMFLFMIEHPRLCMLAGRSQLHRDIPLWHRWLILGLFFDVAAGYRFLRDRLGPEEVVILDEGLLHRAVNLYAWEPRQLDARAVTRYFRLLPAMDLAVVVQAPVELALERATRRGLPIRLRDKDARTIETFMRHAMQIVEIAGAHLAASQRHSIAVDNSAALESGIAYLRYAARQFLSTQGRRHTAPIIPGHPDPGDERVAGVRP